MGVFVSVIGFRKKQIVIEVEIVRAWGAAVLRPYTNVPARKVLLADAHCDVRR